MKIPQSIFLIPLLFSVLANVYGQGSLEAVKSNSKLVTELKDTFNAFHINNVITEQKEMINVLISDGSDAELKTLLDGYIKVCDNLKTTSFNDNVLDSHAKKYLALTSQNYKVLQHSGFESDAFKADFEKYEKETNKYLDYLYATYSTGHFINMTEEKYWQTNDKKNYIKSPDYVAYNDLKATDLKRALPLLEKISKQATDFQEYSVYQIELADQYVKHSDILGDDANDIAIKTYKEITDQKKYSIYLFESWLKWRMVSQQHTYGLSKTSDIPNDQYDTVREQVALTILQYIAKNEKDEMAINEFLLMATHDIVKRFGAYPYGNQNTVEYHETFDEKK